MATSPRYPSLFQINTPVWLQRLSREAGRQITLADIDDTMIGGFAERGFDWIWLLSVWQTGAAGRAVSRGNPEWRREFAAVLPDLTEDDICGSGFAITAYTVSDALGGPAGLAYFRERLASCGIRLMLDFVPNHTAPDHPWVNSHPNYYMEASEEAMSHEPHSHMRVGGKLLAHGRDPNYPGWPDTLQLNYTNPDLHVAQIDELVAIAGMCDGVRCDMAMLLLPEVFQRTWGIPATAVLAEGDGYDAPKIPDFIFMAEAYWDLEWILQQQGFDYCYDKRLYDRLKEGAVGSIRNHLRAGLDYQDGLARFLENHDEPRAAAEYPWPQHQAAAVVTFLSPGLRLFHHGQLEGARVRVPPHLCRGPIEPVNQVYAHFYAMLLRILKETTAFRDGVWSQIDAQSAWPDNWTSECFVAYAWASDLGSRHVVVVNYAGNQGQCRLKLPFPELRGTTVHLVDVLATECYHRDGDDLADNGLYIDLAPWRFNVFALQAV